MQSKTPKFDALLDPILDGLVPHERECKWEGKHPHCEGKFKIEAEDIEFLKMLRVPPPNYCPTCRRMRRLPYMGAMRLFKRTCDAPNHTETMITAYQEKCPFPVYDYKYFISDEFDPFIFGEDYAGTDPMEQLFSLRKRFPMPSFLNRDPSCINSDYSSGGRDLKNGYYTSGCYSCEDIWYSNLIDKSRVVMDSRAIRKSEFVYGSLYSEHLYKTSFAYFSKNCTDSMFLFDCRGCADCFGCVNLRNAKYQIFNKQLSKEEYEEFMKSIRPLSRDKIKEYENTFWKMIRTLPMNASHNVGSTNASGVNIRRSQNIFDVIESDNSENVRHAEGVLSHKDSMDLLFSGGHSHNLYGTVNIGSQSSGVRFSISSKFCTDCEFIFNSKNCTNCFMCFGLQNKSYCILNKQYEADEYFSLVDKIKSEMLEKGQYADGFGFEFSAQAYNFSLAQIAFPLSNEKIIELGGFVGSEQETNVGELTVLSPGDIPQTIDLVKDDIIQKAIRCEITSRPFRIIQTELDFYREMGLPVPTVHPSVRMEEKYHLAATGKKYEAVCAKCGRAIESMFDPADGYLLYCEADYQKEVN